MEQKQIREAVKKRYGSIAKEGGLGCGCGCKESEPRSNGSMRIGYSREESASVPPGADLGLGCGDPVAIASLKEGETVLDLGSGAGFDCFLAAQKVGPSGRVIGVDMTPEMVAKATANAAKGSYGNVEFRLGEIESLPVASGTIDAVISNCVINLSPDKGKVFQEAFRVLKPGGRMLVSDIVITDPLPANVVASVKAYVACLGGALLKEEYLAAIRASGFERVEVAGESAFPVDVFEETLDLQGRFLSLRVAAWKPRGRH